jgi:hypothetical protein
LFPDRRNAINTIFPTVLRRSHDNRAPWFEIGAKLKTPRFLVTREPIYRGVRSALNVLFTRSLPSSRQHTQLFFDRALLRRTRKNRLTLGTSTVIHALFLFLLIYMPQLVPAKETALDSTPPQPEKIFYRVSLDSPKPLPRIAPQGAGARPGNGPFALQFPALGSSAVAHNLTVVSKPKVPDNLRQTIIQPLSPPDLRIKTDIKLPNIILGNQPAAAKPKINLDASVTRPKQVAPQVTHDVAPTVASLNPDPAIPNLAEIPTERPHLPVAFGDPVRPTIAQGKNDNAATSAPDAAIPGDGSGLTIVGVDPSDPSVQLGLPPGNRLGDFTVSAAGGQPGSPGGKANSYVPGGNGNAGTGGDGSIGVGSGLEGGGGGKSGRPGNLSVNSANGGSGGEPVTMRTGSAADLIYPVAATVGVNLRKNALVVSAGPLGGGGLDVYRALYCGKIYTVFLPMPGKNWSMQYCQSSAKKPANDPYATVVHMETSLTPPDPDMGSRFDFHRLPVPIEKARKMIVLKGVLDKDGLVSNLQIYQGVMPAMDEAARVAFSHWKFKPAIRDGMPVAVDILVGIPAEITNARPLR